MSDGINDYGGDYEHSTRSKKAAAPLSAPTRQAVREWQSGKGIPKAEVASSPQNSYSCKGCNYKWILGIDPKSEVCPACSLRTFFCCNCGGTNLFPDSAGYYAHAFGKDMTPYFCGDCTNKAQVASSPSPTQTETRDRQDSPRCPDCKVNLMAIRRSPKVHHAPGCKMRTAPPITAAAETPLCEHKPHKWNIELTQGGIRICRAEHHLSTGCEWEEFVPRGEWVKVTPETPTLDDYKMVRQWLWARKCICGRPKMPGHGFCLPCFQKLEQPFKDSIYKTYRRSFVRTYSELLRKHANG